MKASLFKGSGKWLKATDIETDTNVTISDVTRETLEQDGGASERKGALHFTGDLAALILNSTNTDTMIELFGGETEEWIGKRVTLFVDPNVIYAGKKVPGLRIKGIKTQRKLVNEDAEAPF